MTDKQGDQLLGLSMKMEKSLANIEKSLSATSAKSGAATSVFASLSTAMGSLTSAISSKAFNKKNANDILEFTQNLVKITQDINPEKVKGFGEFSESITNSFATIISLMNPANLLKLAIGSKILFSGKKPVLKTIVEGMSKMFADIDSGDLEKMKIGGEAIKELGIGLLSLTKAMGKLILIGIGAPLILIGALVTRAVVGLFVSLGKNAKEIGEGGIAMKELGKGLAVFSAGLAVMALAVIVIGPQRIIGIIAVVALFALAFNLIGNAALSISRGAQAVAKMSIGLMGFSAALAMLALAVILSTPKTILFGAAALLSFTMVFWVIGKFAKDISEGALVMILGMSVGLFFFSGALMVLGLALKLYSWETLLMGIVVIGAMGVAFALLGNYQAQIDQGALAMAAIGVGLAIFAVGVLIYGLALKAIMAMFANDPVAASLAAAGIILGLGLAFAAVGLVAVPITLGSVAVLTMGAALVVFSIGIMLFGVAIKFLQAMFKDLAEAGKIAAGIILGIGLAFAAVGIVAIPALLGSVAVMAMGASLIVFSLGLIIFGLAVKALMALFGGSEGSLEQAGKIGATIILGLGLAFSVIGLLIVPIVLGATGMVLMGASLTVFSISLMIFGGAIAILKNITGDINTIASTIGNIITGISIGFSVAGLMIVPITLGSIAVMLMGSSLVIISTGLIVFGAAMKLFNDSGLLEKNQNDEWDIKGISVLASMAYHFRDIGKAAFSPWTLPGIAFSVAMGASLFMIGIGLQKAANALKEIPSMDKFINDLFSESGFIPSLANSFSEIGKKHGGILSFIGADPVSLGIRTVKGLSSALQEVAGGIAVFSNFKEFPVKIPDSKDPSKLVYGTVDIFGKVMPGIRENLPGVLGILADVFASIGDKYGDGFWTDSPVQTGMDVVKGMGNILSEIAGGIVAFANFENFPVQIPDPNDPSKLVYNAVNLFDMIPKIQQVLIGDKGVLFSLAGVFANIAKSYPDGFLGDNDVKKGVESVQGIGKEVSDLVGGIVKFANFESFPVQIPDPNNPSKLNYKTVNLFDTIPKIVKVLAGDKSFNFRTAKFDGQEGILISLAGVFAKINQMYPDGFFADGDVAAGVESVKGIGSVISELAGGILAFADVEKGFPEYDKDGKIIGYKPINLEKIKNTIISVVETIPKAFESMDLSKISKAQKTAEEVSDLMKPITKIAKAITDMFIEKNDKKYNLFDTLGSSIATFANSINGVVIGDSQIKMLEDLVDPLREFSKMGDGLSKFATGLEASGQAFLTFSSGFNKFSTSLDKFEKFEVSMSSLITNQSKYNFDKFATSMGELKSNVNAFDVQKLQLADSMMRSMAIISKSPDALADRITETLEQSFKELVAAIKDLAKENVPVVESQPTTSSPIANLLDKKGAPGKPNSETTTMTSIIALLDKSLAGIKTELSTMNSKLRSGGNGGLLIDNDMSA